MWRILYHSRSSSGKDIAVSGMALVPAAQPVGPRPVFAWAHGSAGQGDRCAPSRHIRENLPPYGGTMIANGAAVVATDYEGLGTPGTPTYIVGRSEGHAVLDSVRALDALPNVGALGPVVLGGQSQGGGAALWAAQLAHAYAPELDMRGVAAFAPAAKFATIAAALSRAPFRDSVGETLWVVAGLKAAYPGRVDLSKVLTRKARSDLPRVAQECASKTIARWRDKPVSAVFRRNPLTVKPLVRLLDDNSAGGTNPRMPILLSQGTHDEQIPLQVSLQLHAQYCRLGGVVTRRLYKGASHDGVLDAASGDALAWIADRFAGKPAASDC